MKPQNLEKRTYSFEPSKYSPKNSPQERDLDAEPELRHIHHMPPNVLGYFSPITGKVVVSYKLVPEDRDNFVYMHEKFHKFSGSSNEINADAYASSKTGKYLRFPGQEGNRSLI